MKLLPVIACSVLLMLSTLPNRAQEVFFPGSRYQALADASVGLTGCWSVFGNQAGLAGIDRPEFGGSFQNRFLVAELSTSAGLFVFPVLSSVFAVSVYQFGKSPFRQDKIAIAYARRISPKLNFGIQFNYYRLFLSEDNRSAGSSGLELGIQYLLNDQLTLGFHILNPYETGIKTYSGNFRYPSQINFGTLYRISDSFCLTSELVNDFTRSFRIKTGLEYKILEKLFLRTGISGKPYHLSAGIGFQVRKLTLDLATTYNQYLGNSPSASFQYQF
jgi:hypothetical protein